MIGVGLAWAARWSARLLLVAAGIWLLGFLVGDLWTVVFPTLLAIVLATVFWPPAAFLRRHRFAPALASGVVVVVGIVVIGVLITLVGSAVAGSLPQIVASVVTGVQSVRDWISGPPLNLADSQLTALVQQVTTRIQESVSTIAAGVLAGVGSIASGVITFVLVLILTFLFVKDGPRFLPWVHSVAGPSAGGHLAEVLRRIWVTVGSFIRQQAVVSLVDAVLIGLGLVIVGVPLALPLAVLTFLGGFIPIIGAFVAGAVAVLVALVNNGFAAGVTVLVIVVVGAADRGQRAAARAAVARPRAARGGRAARHHRGQHAVRHRGRVPRRAGYGGLRGGAALPRRADRRPDGARARP